MLKVHAISFSFYYSIRIHSLKSRKVYNFLVNHWFRWRGSEKLNVHALYSLIADICWDSPAWRLDNSNKKATIADKAQWEYV